MEAPVFDLNLSAIFTPLLEELRVQVTGMVLAIAPTAILILVRYLGAVIGISVVKNIIGGYGATDAFIGAGQNEAAQDGDRGRGFFSEDLDGNRTWCPYEDSQLTLDD